MAESLIICCPYCAQEFAFSLDASEGNSEFIIDCEVCCHPMTVSVRMESGEVNDVQVSAA